jgi:hypothetical protein
MTGIIVTSRSVTDTTAPPEVPHLLEYVSRAFLFEREGGIRIRR